jgi:DNA-3-methyladenine glycosylase I
LTPDLHLPAVADIVRHRGKIEAVINNVKRAVELVQTEGSIARYVWGFEPASPDRTPDTLGQLPETTPESVALAKDLKRCGWRFVGPTTMYALMQAMGLVNDHREGCDARLAVTRRGSASRPPEPWRGST